MPSENPDPTVQYHWRRAVAVCLVAVILAGTGGLCWAQGWIPGVSGVALASELKTLDRRITDQSTDTNKQFASIQLLLVKQSIKSELVNRCAARAKNDQAALNAANDQLSDFEEQYRALLGYSYNEPSCDVVLVATPLANN